MAGALGARVRRRGAGRPLRAALRRWLRNAALVAAFSAALPWHPAAAFTKGRFEHGSRTASGTLEQRRSRVLANQVARPFPKPDCPPDRPAAGDCVAGQVALALATLALHPEPGRAGEAHRLLKTAVERTGNAVAAAQGAPAEDAYRARPGAEVVDFSFLVSTLLFRTVGLFGGETPLMGRRLSPEAVGDIRRLFSTWARHDCRLDEADPANVSRPWGSENLDLQRVHTCWAAAELLERDPLFRDQAYHDGSRPSAQRAAWDAYLKAFLRARSGSGLSVEFFSPTYSKYFLNVVYNFMDFASDSELRKLSEDFITLWWAIWAGEQINGVHGGSKSRAYSRHLPAGTPGDDLPWLYTGVGEISREAWHPAYLPMVTSPYRLPDPVEEIARNPHEHGSFAVWTRHLGVADGEFSNRRYSLSPDLAAVTRYTFSTPGYVMGASIVPRLPAAQWAAISSQNRWNGVVLADGPDARVYATPAPQGGRSTYNAVLAAQSRGTQIVQRLPPPFSRGAGDMAIHVGPRLRRVERDGWIFVEGSAFVAARPAFGGYTVDLERQSFRLQDQRSPVVIQAGTRADHAGFEAFQAAVLAAPLRADAQEVRFRGLDGAGDLRFFLDSDRRPEVDGKPIEAPAGWVIHSPFVRQAAGSGTAEISNGSRRLQLRFD